MKRVIGGFFATIIAMALMVIPAFAADIQSVYALPKDNVYAVSNPDRNYLIVVNQNHPIDLNGDYIRKLQPDLVYFPNVVDGDTMAVEKAAYLAFTRMQRDLEVNDGIRIGLYDGYRTAADQVYLLSNGLVSSITVMPGYSEHHTGLLLDVVVWHGGEWCSESEKRANWPEFKTLHAKMADYGFISRYPAGKECITEVPYIPYEIRFVGTSEVAHAISDNDLCLEEFVGLQ